MTVWSTTDRAHAEYARRISTSIRQHQDVSRVVPEEGLMSAASGAQITNVWSAPRIMRWWMGAAKDAASALNQTASTN